MREHPAAGAGLSQLSPGLHRTAPAALREPNAIAVLAIILNGTPGTARLEYEPQDGRLCCMS